VGAGPVKGWDWGSEDKAESLSAGGALSHHHGIGTDHAPSLRRIIGEHRLVVSRALKRELDPEGVMNPGKPMDGTT